jgi:hypothetical protein
MAISTPTTAGQILTSAYVNNNINSGLVYVTSATVGTAVASVTVTGAFNSTYDNYRIVYSGGTGSANSAIKTQLGASAADYYSILNYVSYSSGTTPRSLGGEAQTSFPFSGFASSSGFTGVSYDLLQPFLAKWTLLHAAGYVGNSDSGTSAGLHASSVSYTSFVLSPTSGTLTGGTITVYGYRKA